MAKKTSKFGPPLGNQNARKASRRTKITADVSPETFAFIEQEKQADPDTSRGRIIDKLYQFYKDSQTVRHYTG